MHHTARRSEPGLHLVFVTTLIFVSLPVTLIAQPMAMKLSAISLHLRTLSLSGNVNV